jgi:hypothetical protein
MNATGASATLPGASAAEKLAAVNERTRSKAAARFSKARSASDIEPRSIEWLWQGYAPLGALTLLYGTEGDGKSLLTMLLAAMVTRGKLPGALEGVPSPVDVFAYEDDASAVLVPRLEAAGADLSLVKVHGDDEGSDLLVIPDEVPALGIYLRERGSRLVIIDPLPDALRDGLKDNNNGDVRTGLVPLQRMAATLDVAVLGVSHPNKGATDAANKVMGSKAWRSVPRSVLLFGRDPSDPEDGRVVAVSKTNYARKSSVRVVIDTVTVDGIEAEQGRARLDGASDVTDSDLIAATATRGASGVGPKTQFERARALLVGLLETGGGEVEARTAFVAGAADGISESTMKRARTDLGLTGGKTWVMPEGLPL